MARAPSKKALTYKDAGVDIDVANDLEDGYFKLIKSTRTSGVLDNDGGFGGLFRLQAFPGLFGKRWTDPVLVSGTDGVGTKLKIAFMMDKHDTVGIDLVAMSANDVLVQGAEPLFFLDYVGLGKVRKKVLLDIVKGVAAGCRLAGCALMGGETAEMPGFYAEGEYDLAGCCVGAVERKRLLDGRAVGVGDVVLGLASSGLHSNGYSLVRKALLERAGMKLKDRVPDLGKNVKLGEALLEPTRIYAKPVLDVMAAFKRKRVVHALAHITGGGLVENLPRVLPRGCDAELAKGSWPVPPLFDVVRRAGGIAEDEMYRVFNMGVGMAMVAPKALADAVLEKLNAAGCPAYAIGAMVKGSGRVTWRR